MLEKIEEHFKNEYPREGCGIIGIVKGKKEWFPCRNIASNEDDFIMSSDDYFDVVKRADILAIVHSHPDTENTASPYDIKNCNALGIPYWIFSYPDMELNILQPRKHINPLIGREYEFGVTDCFEAMRDYLKQQNIEIPPRAPFEDNWWDNELDYFSEDIIKNWGGIKVDTPQKNDVLIFKVKADVPDHCGVYLGNDIFFHHAENRLSCRENLYPFWAKYIVGIYRHVA
jgi:proteasome lid subunit RPN8/RPN11